MYVAHSLDQEPLHPLFTLVDKGWSFMSKKDQAFPLRFCILHVIINRWEGLGMRLNGQLSMSYPRLPVQQKIES